MTKANPCRFCDDLCYYDENEKPNSLEEQILFHRFYGWSVASCATAAEVSDYDVEEIIAEEEKRLYDGGSKLLRERCLALEEQVAFLSTGRQFSLFFRRVARLQKDISTVRVENSKVAAELQKEVEAVRMRACVSRVQGFRKRVEV